MRLFFLLVIILAGLCPAPAQLFLQMERYGKAATTKFGIGTELTFRLQGEKEWETALLDRILPEENRILLGTRYIAPSEIEAIRSFHPQKWSRPIGNNLYLFGASWTGFALGAWIADKEDPYSVGDALVTVTAVGAGFLLQKLFHHRTYHMGERRRLRILDMRVIPEGKP
ncbi:MAG: hypothetical protein IPL49_12675 [Saprospirales bacterium]|nr:hypothetical protein [Saprospirales bacterium]